MSRETPAFFLAGAEDTYNEAQLAPFLASVDRDLYVVATKFMPQKYDGKCDYDTVKAACVASLARLGLKSVDLYYSVLFLKKTAILTERSERYRLKSR